MPFKADFSVDIESQVENFRCNRGLEPNWKAAEVERFVTEYIWHEGDSSVRFAIDSHDGKEIFSPILQKRCDLYFKANKWKAEEYPANVRPLVNGNGFLRRRHLEKLKNFRGLSKDNDLLFISRVWGGVEHNVRLFEALASLNCKKKLVAIFVKGAEGVIETADAIKRLESVGVICTLDLMPIKDLWLEMAQSRLVMLRAGKYMCIPWRMIDLLCMGTAIVTDADFEPEWPTPLVPDVHYVSAGIIRPSDTTAAPVSEYEKIAGAVMEVLGDEARIAGLQRKSADYFDMHAAPERVGHHIVNSISGLADV